MDQIKKNDIVSISAMSYGLGAIVGAIIISSSKNKDIEKIVVASGTLVLIYGLLTFKK